jgi:hypothetical protein
VDLPGRLPALPAEFAPAEKAGLAVLSLPSDKTAEGRVIRVGPAQPVRTIAAAAAIAGNGDTIEIEAGDYIADVAIWKQDRLVIRGIGGKPRLIADGKSAEGKAIWVMRGGHITVENIVFSGAKVSDRNGAGIRFERGNLIVRNCAFVDNENGILTGSGGETLAIENSEFARNGAGDGRSHNLYVGAIKSLSVTGSYFHHARVGHLLKSRAAENRIMYNRLSDEAGGRASYELEFPNGGYAYVIGNIIQQSVTTENSTIIAFGMEGYKWPANQLYLFFNTIVNDLPGRGALLGVKAGADKVVSLNNLLVGDGGWNIAGSDQADSADTGAILLKNNVRTHRSSFVQPSQFDYRLKKSALADVSVIDMEPANSFALVPQREYVFPTDTRPLTGPPVTPGALQSRALDASPADRD